jgi:hypothetical protein
MKFIECCDAYDASSAVLVNGAKGHSVPFNALAIFNEARIALAKGCKNASLQDDKWEKGRKLFAQIHAILARSPCRPKWLISELLEKEGKVQIITDLMLRLPNVDPSLRQMFEKAISTLNQLRLLEKNPICEEIATWQKMARRVVCVLEETKYISETKTQLDEALGSVEWEMTRPSGLRTFRQADCVVVFGPVWLLKYRKEEFLLRAPISSQIRILACRHEFGGELAYSQLDPTKKIFVASEISHAENEVQTSFEALPSRRENLFRFKEPQKTEDWCSGNNINALPFKFGGGKGTFFAPETAVWIAKIKLNEGLHICTGVEKTEAENLEPGDLVLMTTGGGGDMIPVVADMILGEEAQKLRGIQSAWKASLKKVLNRIGTQGVASQLKILGAQKATPSNIRNWCNPRSIGMEDLELDLRALLQLTGLADEFDMISDSIERLRRAHTSAGFQLQRKLRESLCGKDFSTLLSKGWLEIKGDGGSAKTVFLVEERGELREIPEEWEGDIRDVEE